MLESSLSLAELRAAARVDVPPPTMLAAEDGVRLACRRYVPAQPRAALLFYHGGGAHSAAGYQFLGAGLRDQFGIATYTPDIRGHGSSEGRRGDTPSVERVWDDVNVMLRWVHREHPRLPIFLGGHSSGAALVLNHAAWAGREPVSGHLLVSPQLGARAGIDRPPSGEPFEPFVRIEPGLFAAYAASGGSAGAHEYAVRFGYPDSLLAADPGLVAAITVAMSAALIPPDPERQLADLDPPFGLWIGAEDEIFDPEAMLAFARRAVPPDRQAEVAAIPGARHLGILVGAHAFVGPWLQRQLDAGRGPA